MVGQFQKNVLIVSAVVFLIVMIVIGVIMKKSLLDGKYHSKLTCVLITSMLKIWQEQM